MRRGSVFVDSIVQSRLAWKVISYWFFCLLAVEVFVACWLVWIETPRSSLELISLVMRVCAIPFAASLLLLPVVILDSIRFSHRFAGPMVRIRRSMKEVADGLPGKPVILRDGDFWNDFAADYNRLIERIDQMEAQLRELQTQSQSQRDEACNV